MIPYVCMEPFSLFGFALLQGATELLPISSSGHLAILNEVLGTTDTLPALSIALHAATLLAVVAYFLSDLIALAEGVVKGRRSDREHLTALILATLPLVLIGPFLYSVADQFHHGKAVAIALIVSGGSFLLLDRVVKYLPRTSIPLWRKGISIGLVQAVALLPGVSRSGAAMVAGRLVGFSREEAVRFAFLLSIPAISGALLLSLISTAEHGSIATLPLVPLALSFCIAFSVAYATIHYFLKWVHAIGYAPFFLYQILLGSIVLMLI